MWSYVVIAVIIIVFIILYNSLVNKKNQTENAFSGIDVLLKKRYDLIPNLVSAVKAYMKHEQGVLTQITELRTKAMSGQLTDDEKVAVDNQMTRVLKGMMVSVEKYPELKANGNFLQLQAALNEVEEQISAARRAYNAAVTEYNNAVEMIPTNFIALLMRYRKKTLFEIAAGESNAVNVQKVFEG